MDIALVAIAAFDIALVFGNRQPDPGMARRAASITSDLPFGHNLGFGGVDRHAAFLGMAIISTV